MALDDVADELYAVAPDDFMASRTEQVAAAKAAGDKELAKQIGSLRKPTRSAWLVNLLARDAPTEISELLELGGALREAQQNLDGAELRSLSSSRHKVINGLSRRAAALGGEAGYTATEAVRQEVSQTLQAAMADPEQAELVRRGVLSQAVSYGGFGPFDLAAPAAKKPAEKTAAEKTPTSRRGATSEADDESPEDAAREAAREAAEAAWQQAKDELAGAEAEAEQATVDADALADRVDELRRQLQEAEQAEDDARRSARAARKRVDELTAAERQAQRDLEDLDDDG